MNSAHRKPSKLQLQVPQHQGGPVRLATPPRVLVNGESQLQAAAANHERHSSGEFLPHDYSDSEDLTLLDTQTETDRDIDWKRRCFALTRKLQEKEEELKKVRRAVLDAVM